MANKDDDASATGCGCLIILAVLRFGIYKLVNWASANQGTVESFWQMAKKVGLIALVLIVIWFVLKRYLNKRKLIKNWEKTELKKWLSDNNIENSLTNADAIVKKARARCEAAESGFPAVRRNLKDFHNREKTFK